METLGNLQKWLEPYPGAYDLVIIAALLLAAWLANWVTKKVLLRGLRRALRATALGGKDQDREVQLRVIPRLANVVPALVVSAGVNVVPHLPAALVSVIQAICQAFIVLTIALAISRALDMFNQAYEKRPDAYNKPIKGYLQVAKIVMFALVGISIVATLIGAKFLHIVTGLGAVMAVLILVFQDTLLSLVASVQISSDGRVRIGDWIEMPSQNADGDVIDIALHTVTVRNWDMTTTTIPTKKLISDSFKNWRGMNEAGGRRIKRALFLDQKSVRFLDDGELVGMERFALLDDYLGEKRLEVRQWNAALAERGSEAVNTRRLTNLGTFRIYVQNYLRQHPGIHQGMTLLVRQLQPTDAGLPLEIYCFTSDIRWDCYEAVQSDIFDHLLAILPEFDLRVFQSSSDAPRDVRLHDPRSARPGA